MRPPLMLASFLAILPVSLICLALNPRIHIDQFVHSLYLRLLPLLNRIEELLAPGPVFFLNSQCRTTLIK